MCRCGTMISSASHFSFEWEATWRCPYAEPSNLILPTRAHKSKVCYRLCLKTRNILWNNTVQVCKGPQGQFVLLKSQTACWIVSILWGHSVRNWARRHMCRSSSCWFVKCMSNTVRDLLPGVNSHRTNSYWADSHSWWLPSSSLWQHRGKM